MFSNQNPLFVQIRRELRGGFPDSWAEEILGICEYQLSYSQLDDQDTETLLKLRIATQFSPTLLNVLNQAIAAHQQNPYQQPRYQQQVTGQPPYDQIPTQNDGPINALARWLLRERGQ
ncbi:MAG: hypothetical protein ACKO24_08050 [Leptolyngbyaceae cyanobacterium]